MAGARRAADVVIAGGGVVGSFAALWLRALGGAAGPRVTVVERDPRFRAASSVLSCGGFRQQFSLLENIRLSMASLRFIKDEYAQLAAIGADEDECNGPKRVGFAEEGYLFMAGTEQGAQVLRENNELQLSEGAHVALLEPRALAERFPFLHCDDIRLASLGTANEGWLDPYTLLMDARRKAAELGVTFKTGCVNGVQVDPQSRQVTAVTLEGGEEIECGALVNAAGAWSGKLAELAGVALPVEPRLRHVFSIHSRAMEGAGSMFCPLTVDPSGVYFRREGRPGAGKFICGVSPAEDQDVTIDPAMSADDLAAELERRSAHEFFEDQVWPVLANRVPAFAELKVTGSWAGCYDFNTLDYNAVVGPHPEIKNLFFATGFSGHGLQMSVATGRAVAEHLLYSSYRSIDLTRFGFDRITRGERVLERNIV